MVEGLLGAFRESQRPPNKALKLSAIDYFCFPGHVRIVMKEISVVDKVSQFVNIRLGKNFICSSNFLGAGVSEVSKQRSRSEVFGIGDTAESLEAWAYRRRNLPFIIPSIC